MASMLRARDHGILGILSGCTAVLSLREAADIGKALNPKPTNHDKTQPPETSSLAPASQSCRESQAVFVQVAALSRSSAFVEFRRAFNGSKKVEEDLLKVELGLHANNTSEPKQENYGCRVQG